MLFQRKDKTKPIVTKNAKFSKSKWYWVRNNTVIKIRDKTIGSHLTEILPYLPSVETDRQSDHIVTASLWPELEILSVQKPSIFKFPPYFESISSQVEGHLFLTLLQKGTNKNGFFSCFAELFNLLCCGEHYLYLFYFLSYILFAATSPFSLKSYVESWARNKHVFIGSIFVTSLSLLNMWSGDFALACLDFTDVIRTKLCY